MFEDMGFINTYKIDLHTLARSDHVRFTNGVKNCVYPAVQIQCRFISVAASLHCGVLHKSFKYINYLKYCH